MDQLIRLIIGILTFLGVLLAAWIARASRKQVNEIHIATTENHHAHEKPTLPDQLDTINTDLTALTAKVDAQHDEQKTWNVRQDARLHDGTKHFARLDSIIARHHGETL